MVLIFALNGKPTSDIENKKGGRISPFIKIVHLDGAPEFEFVPLIIFSETDVDFFR